MWTTSAQCKDYLTVLVSHSPHTRMATFRKKSNSLGVLIKGDHRSLTWWVSRRKKGKKSLAVFFLVFFFSFRAFPITSLFYWCCLSSAQTLHQKRVTLLLTQSLEREWHSQRSRLLWPRILKSEPLFSCEEWNKSVLTVFECTNVQSGQNFQYWILSSY